MEVTARSILADVFLFIDYLDASSGEIIADDDSAGGLFGTDARIVYRAPHSGSYSSSSRTTTTPPPADTC